MNEVHGSDENPKMTRPDSTRMADSTESIEESGAAKAFGTIANEVRVGILRVLFDAQQPRSFSELRDDVGIYDSGRFNYHLGELEGQFVRKTDRGYGLTYAGRQVIGSIHSGIYTDRVTMDPIDAGDCFECEGRLGATYEGENVQIKCSDCGQPVTTFGVAPTLLDGFERDELPMAFSNWVMTSFQRTKRGFCPECSGRTRVSEVDGDKSPEGLIGVCYTCDVCELVIQGLVGVVVLDHPAVVAFHDEHGIDYRQTPFWEIPWLFENCATIESEDPLSLRITPEIEGDRISLLLDEDLSVVSIDCEGNCG